MTRRDAFALAMKVVGVIWVVRTLHAVPESIHSVAWLRGSMEVRASLPLFVGLPLLWLALGLGLGWLLVVRADALAGLLVHEEGFLLGEGETPGERTLLAVGTRLVGLVFAALAAPRLVMALRDLAQYRILQSDPRFQEALAARPFAAWDPFVSPAVTLLVGLGLLLGGAALAKLLAGPEAAPSAEEVTE